MSQSRKASLNFFYMNSFLTLLVGNMFVYAMIIYSRAILNSDGFTGFVYIFNYVPALVLSFYAGTVLDRYSRKKILYIFQTSFIITSGVLAFVITLDPAKEIYLWLLPSLMCVNGASLAFIIPGRMALLGNLVEQREIPHASMLLHLMIIIGFGLAPALVGAIKQYSGWAAVFIAISFLYLLAYMFLIPVRPVLNSIQDNQNPWDSFRDGIRFVRSSPLILELLLFTFIGLFMVGPIQVLLPQFAKTVLELTEFQRGIFMTALGAGLLFGGIIAKLAGHKFPRGLMMLTCSFVGGFCMIGIALSRNVFPATALLTGAGIFGGTLSTLIPALIQSETPDESRGRVMSIYTLIFQMTPAFSGLLLSQLSDVIGISDTLFSSGIFITLISAMGLIFLKGLRAHR